MYDAQPGQPCPVCGKPVHYSPLSPDLPQLSTVSDCKHVIRPYDNPPPWWRRLLAKWRWRFSRGFWIDPKDASKWGRHD